MDEKTLVINATKRELDAARDDLKNAVKRIADDASRALEGIHLGREPERMVSFVTSSDFALCIQLRERIMQLELMRGRLALVAKKEEEK